MVNKDVKIEIRCTPAEKRAVTRFARSVTSTGSISDLVRARVIVPAVQHDPKQTLLPLAGKEVPPNART